MFDNCIYLCIGFKLNQGGGSFNLDHAIFDLVMTYITEHIYFVYV